MYVLYALKLKLRLKKSSFKVIWLRSNLVSNLFITQIGHRPGSQTQITPKAKRGLTK